MCLQVVGWVDENGNLNSAIKVKTLAEGAAAGIIAAFDHNLSSTFCCLSIRHTKLTIDR